MENKILFVGGTWDLNGGKKSKIVDEFAKYIPNTLVYNGGNYNDLNKILESCINYDIVIWWANVSNDLPKVRNVKEINYKTMLISSKRNIDNKYSIQDLLERSFKLKSNLTVEFSKKENKYNMRLFDPLGNEWYDGLDIEKCAKAILDRLKIIKNITREKTIKSEENFENISTFFKSDLNQIYKSNDNPVIPIKNDFLSIVKNYAYVFAKEMVQKKMLKDF